MNNIDTVNLSFTMEEEDDENIEAEAYYRHRLLIEDYDSRERLCKNLKRVRK
jgi:hypothetical protein